MWKAAIPGTMTAAMLAGAGCLNPLVSDTPSASANLLAADKPPPLASKDPELSSQINTNDGLDDATLRTTGTIPLVTNGSANGKAVNYWAFGPMTRAPSPLYFLVKDDDAHTRIDAHPPWVDAMPGDPAYSAIHTVFLVTVTDKYKGERITTSAALSDAVDLGLVKTPTPMLVPNTNPQVAYHIASPIVLDGIKIALDGAGNTATATPVYGHHAEAGIFLFGGQAGFQPGQFIQPTYQVSFLREQGASAAYDQTHPVFQVVPPADETTMPTTLNYTPLTTVVNVDLLPGHHVSDITADSQLFNRDTNGTILSTTDIVASFVVTTNVILDEQQYASGAL